MKSSFPLYRLKIFQKIRRRIMVSVTYYALNITFSLLNALTIPAVKSALITIVGPKDIKKWAIVNTLEKISLKQMLLL